MSFRQLLRLPGTSCPPEALTGDEILDAYITDLDSRLLGSKYVRLLTLAEIRDHLEEAKARGIAAGLDEKAAAEEAVRVAGHPEEHAAEQRASLRSRFLKIALPSGILFGIWMGVWASVAPPYLGLLGAIVEAVLEGAFFGLWMGVFMAFIWPRRWLGARSAAGRPDEGFEVAYPRPMRRLSTAFFIVFVVLALVCLSAAVATLLKITVPGEIVPRWYYSFFLGAMAVLAAYVMAVTSPLFRVTADGFLFRRLLTAGRFVNWRDVTAVGTLGDVHPWIPSWNNWHAVKYLVYTHPGRRPRRILIYRDLVNADRFLQLVEENVLRNRGAMDPSLSIERRAVRR